MKKLSVLIAAALLSTASVTYADEAALDDLLERLGLDRSFLEDILPETGGDEQIAEILALWEIPDQIFWDNSDPVQNRENGNPYPLSLCGTDPVLMDDTSRPPYEKRVMGEFKVIVNGSYVNVGGLVTPFNNAEGVFVPDTINGGGQAEVSILGGPGNPGVVITLKHHGNDSWFMPWELEIPQGVTIHSIELDLLSEYHESPNPSGRDKHTFGVFDILLRPNDLEQYLSYYLGTHNNDGNPDEEVNIGTIPHPSPGSGAGWPVQLTPPRGVSGTVGPNVLYTATFHNPVLLPSGSLEVDEEGDAKPHDLYGKVVINFNVTNNNGVLLQQGIQGVAALGNLGMVFWQDTDCLPIHEFAATYLGNGKASYQAIGVNMNLYLVKASDSSSSGEDVEHLGSLDMEGTLKGTVSDLEEGSCYWVEDRNDNGARELLYGPACL